MNYFSLTVYINHNGKVKKVKKLNIRLLSNKINKYNLILTRKLNKKYKVSYKCRFSIVR